MITIPVSGDGTDETGGDPRDDSPEAEEQRTEEAFKFAQEYLKKL